jgi:hypothetical protein
MTLPLRHVALAALLGLSAPVAATADPSEYFAVDGVALAGTDVVAYFTEGRAVPGDPGMSLKWGGVMWRFLTEDNREAFEMNPRGFAPQFGGYAALGVAQGRLAAIRPEVFAIHDGALFLDESPAALGAFEADLAANIARARGNWPALLGK